MRALAIASAALIGCTAAGNDGFDTSRSGEPMPDFGLMDVNASSASFDTEVTVQGQRGRVSAWYFGHST